MSTSFKSWRQPNSILSSRKDIWENFPVSLVQLGRDENDLADRHAVVWNRKQLVDWRQKCPDPNSWYLHEKTIEARLLSELRRSTKWFVEQRQRDDQICIIRMAFKNAPSNRNQQTPPYTENVPILTRLKDIQEFFPMVIWHEVGFKTYSIELSHKKLHVCNNPATVANTLYKDLKASTAWNVQQGHGDEMCRISLV